MDKLFTLRLININRVWMGYILFNSKLNIIKILNRVIQHMQKTKTYLQNQLCGWLSSWSIGNSSYACAHGHAINPPTDVQIKTTKITSAKNIKP